MTSLAYKFIRFIFKISNKKPMVYGESNYDPSTPAMFMCNHEKFYGPIIITTRFPIPSRIWANSMTTEMEECKKYIEESLFMGELGKKEKFSRFMGNFLGGFASWVIRNSNPIVAYLDNKRTRISIRKGLDVVKKGENQLIFAKRREFQNNEIKFMQGYLFICKLSVKKFRINQKIYPVAINKENASMSIGKPTVLNIEMDYKKEEKRINQYLTHSISIGYKNPRRMAQDTYL